MSGAGALAAAGGPGAGDARLKVVKESLFRGRERSTDSGRESGAGAGDDGRLAGRRKEGVLMACIGREICVRLSGLRWSRLGVGMFREISMLSMVAQSDESRAQLSHEMNGRKSE